MEMDYWKEQTMSSCWSKLFSYIIMSFWEGNTVYLIIRNIFYERVWDKNREYVSKMIINLCKQIMFNIRLVDSTSQTGSIWGDVKWYVDFQDVAGSNSRFVWPLKHVQHFWLKVVRLFYICSRNMDHRDCSYPLHRLKQIDNIEM